MSCCASPYIKRINPLTGAVIVYDTATGLPVSDAALIASLVPCPTTEPDKEKVCLQVIGNTDPSLIESGWQITAITIAADGTITLGVPVLTLNDMSDVTATHEVVECPDTTPIDLGFCLPA